MQVACLALRVAILFLHLLFTRNAAADEAHARVSFPFQLYTKQQQKFARQNIKKIA